MDLMYIILSSICLLHSISGEVPSAPLNPEIAIEDEDDRSPMVVWETPERPNAETLEYYVRYTVDNYVARNYSWWGLRTRTSSQLNSLHTVIIGNIIICQTYIFKVQAKNQDGFGPLSEMVMYRPGSNRYCQRNPRWRSSYVPRLVPVYLSLEAVEETDTDSDVRLLWAPVNATDERRAVTGYLVMYTESWYINEHRNWRAKYVQHPQTSTVIDQLNNGTLYYIWVEALNRHGVGPESERMKYKPGPESEEYLQF